MVTLDLGGFNLVKGKASTCVVIHDTHGLEEAEERRLSHMFKARTLACLQKEQFGMSVSSPHWSALVVGGEQRCGGKRAA